MTQRRGRILAGFFIAAALVIAPARFASAQQDTEPPSAPVSEQQSSPAPADDGSSATGESPTGDASTAAPPAPAAELLQSASDRADAWKAELDDMTLALEREGLSEARLAQMRTVAERVIADSRTLTAQIEPEVQTIQDRLDQLGPAPGDGEPPESPDIVERRQTETAALTAADAALKKVRLATVQAEQVIREIASVRRDRFARSLFARHQSILNPSLWIDGVRGAPDVVRGFVYLVDDSLEVVASRATVRSVLIIGAGVLVAIVIGVFIRRSMRRFAPPVGGDEEEVSRLQKLLRALLVMLTDGILPVLAVAVIYGALEISGLRVPRMVELNRGLFAAIAIFSFIFGLARGVFAPLRPGWRLVHLSDGVAAQILASITVLAGVLAVSAYLEAANDVLVAPVSVEVLKRAVTALLIALFVGSALLRAISATDDEAASEPEHSNVLWPWLRGAVWIAIFVIAAALLAGFIAFAHFVALQLVLAGVIFTVVWLLLGLIEESTNVLLSPANTFTSRISSTFGIGESGITQIALVASGLLRLLLMALGVVMVLLPWGLDTAQWRQWIQRAFFGFRIGEVTISLSSFVIALTLFALGLIVTRAIQGWLGNRFLPNTHLDVGLRNSIRTMVGYAGVILAALFAVTFMGLNLESIALLAGALSVGIGFGLQSIVNNFVSGLILLAERPIKEGDWIVVGAEQGYVRKISIRATEIETFDRSSVIIPNSDLITGTVNNWMHSNKMGRAVIAVGVSYQSDPEQVRDILLDIARRHADVLAYPEPRVYFVDFGDSSLVFNLFVYLGDINNTLTVRSDFRFEILKRFREASIEIPFPQRDINLRDIDRIETAMAEQPRVTGKADE